MRDPKIKARTHRPEAKRPRDDPPERLVFVLLVPLCVPAVTLTRAPGRQTALLGFGIHAVQSGWRPGIQPTERCGHKRSTAWEWWNSVRLARRSPTRYAFQ